MFSTKFISATKEYSTIDRHVPAPLLRKMFTLNGDFSDAAITICGLGFYRLFINGVDVTKGHLAPYISNPDHILYYDRYDAAPYLKSGENCLGVMLGNGMQNSAGGKIFNWDFDDAVFRSAPKLALSFESAQLTFEADESFMTDASPITFDSMRLGEFYDARLEQRGWNTAGFDAKAWNNAICVEPPRGTPMICGAEPIVTTHTIKPVAITKADSGYIYDFGVNAAGVCRLRIDGKPGQEITMAHGEHLENGELCQDGISDSHKIYPKGYCQAVRYTCNGSSDYTPSFTYFGFRYVSVSGIEEFQATDELLTYHVMNSDIKERGGFSCSDEVANKLQDCTRRSTLANFYYFPTDCPQREKNGWTGDASVSAEHTLLNLQAENSYAVWLDNIRKAQNERGEIPGIVPTAGWGYGGWNGPAWDNVLINLPYYTYIYRGDRKILEDNATAIFRYLNYITTRQDGQGLVAIGLGDWCTPNREPDDYKTPLVVTDSILCMDFCQKAAFVFGVLGQDLQRKFALAQADKLREAIRKHLVNLVAMTVAGNCQTSQAMGLFYGVFEPGEKTQAFNVLLELIAQADNHLDVGILGARVLFHVLAAFGESDLAYKMITQPTHPSYGNWIEQGATSLFETFHPAGKHVLSLNHHFFGDISSWFIKHIGGIQLNPCGGNVNEVNICPSFIDKLTWAEAFHIATAGEIRINWKRNEGKIELNIELPEGMTGRIILPIGYAFEDGVCEKPVKPGKYVVEKIGV